MDSITLPESLTAQLRDYEQRLRTWETVAAAAVGVVGMFAAYCILFISDRFCDTPRIFRCLLALAGAAIPAWAAYYWARTWLWERRGPAQLAKLLQRHFRTLGDRLQGVIELAEATDLPPNISPALLRAAIRQVAEESSLFRFTDAVPIRPARRRAGVAFVVAALGVAPFLLAPRAAKNALVRLLAPWASIERYTFASISKLPSRFVVAHGEPFDIACGFTPDSAWKPAFATVQIVRQEPQVARIEQGNAIFHISGQTQETTLTFKIGDAHHEMTIIPKHRPELKRLEARIEYPEYLGYPSATVSLQGSAAEFLERSKIAFVGQTGSTLEKAQIREADTHFRATIEETSFTTPLQIVAALVPQVAFEWSDRDGLSPAKPYLLRVSTRTDSEPRVDLQGLDAEGAMLPQEVLRLNIIAGDDYGIKSTWLVWRVVQDGGSKEASASGETIRVEGGFLKKEFTSPVNFSPALLRLPEDGTVEISAKAVDYFPGREPVESLRRIVHILSPAKHAENVRERMEQALKDLDERIRDEERQADETTALTQNKAANSSAQSAEDLKRVEEGEKMNAERMEKLTEQMSDLQKDALRNPEIPESTIADWQQIRDTLEKDASPAMSGAAESLAQASENPGSQSKDLADAGEKQQKALEAMRKASKKMDSANDQLHARNFYNRLRASAADERNLSGNLRGLAKATVGLMPEEIAEPQHMQFEATAAKQDTYTAEVAKIGSDLEEFTQRVTNDKYEAVWKEMEDRRTVPELAELSVALRASLAMKSVRRAAIWAQQLDAWATMLQKENRSEGSGEGDGEMDPALMELVIAMVRIAQAEDYLRAETGLLEAEKTGSQRRPEDMKRMAAMQDRLRTTTEELRASIKHDKAITILKQAEELMKEVAADFRKDDSSTKVSGLQSIIIETLVPPDEKNDSDSQMNQMARKMMAQATRSRSAGGNNAKSSGGAEGDGPDGASSRIRASARPVEKTGGAVNSGEWPEEYRDQLQSYLQAIGAEEK